jgi:hypothetical protein
VTPNLTPERLEAIVAKLKADPAGALECEFPDKLRDDGTVDYYWHNSRGRARLLFLNTAAVGNQLSKSKPVQNFAASLLTLYAPDAPMASDAALEDWAKRWHLDSAPWTIEWARMVLRAHDDREQDKQYSAATAHAPVIADIPIINRDNKPVGGTLVLGMRFTPPPTDPGDYDWIKHVLPATVRTFTSPSPKPWQPDVISRVQYRNYICGYRRMDKGRRVYEPGYLDAVKAQALKAGMTETPRPLREREPKHYDWLVRYQLKGDGLPLIARMSREPAARVWKGIKDLARDIGLEPRKESRL